MWVCMCGYVRVWMRLCEWVRVGVRELARVWANVGA